MKKTFWIISIVILILIISSLTFYFYFANKTKCEFKNTDECNKSCKTDADCKFSTGYCVNVNENVFLPKNVMPSYEEFTCKCENNECVGESTGRVTI